jgi:hypothetical protein
MTSETPREQSGNAPTTQASGARIGTDRLRACLSRHCYARCAPMPAAKSSAFVDRPTKVYILGAGCSVCGNYPLAADVAATLRTFAETRLTHDNAKELRRCALQTCALLKEKGVNTLDLLAEHLNRTNHGVIREAKLAMSASFFALEDAAVQQAYGHYEPFFREVFRYGDSHLLDDRARETPCRVISYNYDRLFERTFIEWAKRAEPLNQNLADNLDGFVKRFLNTGFHNSGGITFEPNHFSFLELHGGIGQFNRTGYHGMNHIYWPRFGTAIPDFNDDPYYEKKGHGTNLPTIAFPSDKKLRPHLGKDHSFRVYMDAVEEQAKAFCRTAKEIQIIGYSMQDVDYFTFKALIAEAKNCKRIVLRNRASEKSTLMRTLEGLKEDYDAGWEIEYKAEDFFAR